MSFKFDEYKFYKNINTNKKTLINQLKLNELKQLENKNRLNENFKKEQKRIEKINKPILPNDLEDDDNDEIISRTDPEIIFNKIKKKYGPSSIFGLLGNAYMKSVK